MLALKEIIGLRLQDWFISGKSGLWAELAERIPAQLQ